MAFRYINPGYAELLEDSQGAETVENRTFNPTNGVAFSAQNKLLTIIPAGKIATKFFCKFDLYQANTRDTGATFYLGMARYNAPTNVNWIAGVRCQYSKISLRENSLDKASFTQNYDTVNAITIGFNMSDATCEISVNGVEKSIVTFSYPDVYNVQSPVVVSFPSTTEGFYISNLIVSDAEISSKEKVTVLPISMTATNMAAGASGLYLADAAEQTLLQTPNVSTLINNFGASSAVTGIAVVGNPAYRTGTGITTLTGLSISGGSVAEHGTCNLSDDTTATAMDGWATENLTLSDLQNMQFGWKVGE